MLVLTIPNSSTLLIQLILFKKPNSSPPTSVIVVKIALVVIVVVINSTSCQFIHTQTYERTTNKLYNETCFAGVCMCMCVSSKYVRVMIVGLVG